MLIDFSIKNFRSIREKQIFSMQPMKRIKELKDNLSEHDEKLLKSAIVYGSNASGKSNLLRAFKALEFLVGTSDEFRIDEIIEPYEPYLLDETSKKKPVEIEINFIAKNKIHYNYQIEFTEKEIKKEALYFFPKNKITKLFIREKGKKLVVGNSIKENLSEIENKLYPNQLFLSKVGKEKIDALIAPFRYLTRHFTVNISHRSTTEDSVISVISESLKKYKKTSFEKNLNQLLRVADTGIKGIKPVQHKETDFKFPKNVNKEMKDRIMKENQFEIRANHDLYRNKKAVNNISFPISEESTGTKKLLVIGSAILSSLDDGDTIVIDELDKSLHPHLTALLIQLFHSPKTNPRNAQLIFASHDVSLLSNKIFRRDQIYFAEKNTEGASKYYSLADIKGIRKELSFDKYYLKGFFGGTPFINKYDLNLEFTADEAKKK